MSWLSDQEKETRAYQENRIWSTLRDETQRNECPPRTYAWLLVTSLERSIANTKQIIHLYKTRMQIEEVFRDMKNSRWGFSLNEARCNATYRYENLLLITQLAIFAVWLGGQVAGMKS